MIYEQYIIFWKLYFFITYSVTNGWE